jgi:regulator of RNase E activity RraA
MGDEWSGKGETLNAMTEKSQFMKTKQTDWKDDGELFARIRRELYTPVVGDILDEFGRYHRILPAPVQPMRETMVVVGRAMPALMIDVYGPQKKPFGLLTEALDDLKPGEVYVASGGEMRCAYWGELLTAAARTRGAVGAVVNGYHRDTPQVLAQNWPVFSRGRFCQDSSVRTQVADFRCGIEIGGVWIESGDLVFGDQDGVVVIPREIETEVITRALEKASKEKVVRKAIENGMSTTEAFATYGIL